jgi:hypothetical protein
MTTLGKANWWAPRFMRERPRGRHEAVEAEREPELAGVS